MSSDALPMPETILAYYQAIARSFPAGVVGLCDRELIVRVIDGRGLRATGLDPARLINRPITALWPAEVLSGFLPTLEGALAGHEGVAEVDYLGRRWRVRAIPVTDEAGVVAAVVGYARDLTAELRMQAAVADGERRVRRIIEELPTPVLLMDLDTMRAEFANAAFHRMLGYAAGAISSMGSALVAQLVHPDDQAFIAERFATLFGAGDGDVVESTFRARHADGAWRWAQTRNIVFARHPDGRARTMLTTAEDVTERRVALEAIEGSHQALLEAQRVGRLGSWEWEPLTGRMRWSAEMCRLWGRDPEGAAPTVEEFAASIPGDERARVLRELEQAARHGDGFSLVHRVERPPHVAAEPLLHVHCRGTVRRDAAGRPVLVTGTSQDVTEIEEALAAARDAAERYRLAVAVTRDVVYDFLVDGDPILWNEAMRTVFGHAIADDGRTSFAWWTERVHPDDRARVDRSLVETLAGTATAWNEEYRFRRGDGQYALVLDRAHIMRDAQGAAVRLIGSMSDETARRALDARLRQAAKLDALGTLAGGIAHDFNNILAGILGFAEEAAADLAAGDAEAAGDAMHEVAAAARRARDLVRRILTFSRTDDARRERVHVQALVDETRRLLRATLPATVDLVVTVPPEPLHIVGDPTLLQQSLVNLCTNAEHAMRGRPVRRLTITLTAVAYDADEARRHGVAAGMHACLTVADTGRGMPPEVAERAFEPFFTTKQVGEGTGLGLAMVHGAVTAAGGSVEIHSTPGEGTEVVLLLPRAAGDTVPPVGAADRAAPAVPLDVLVVDDEPMVLRALDRMLTRLGHRPVVVATPEAALDRLADGGAPVDVLLTDLTMPGLTGDRLAAHARGLRPTLPVVLMTGYGGSLTASQAAAAGIAAVIEKPIDTATLGGVLREVGRG